MQPATASLTPVGGREAQTCAAGEEALKQGSLPDAGGDREVASGTRAGGVCGTGCAGVCVCFWEARAEVVEDQNGTGKTISVDALKRDDRCSNDLDAQNYRKCPLLPV